MEREREREFCVFFLCTKPFSFSFFVFAHRVTLLYLTEKEEEEKKFHTNLKKKNSAILYTHKIPMT